MPAKASSWLLGPATLVLVAVMAFPQSVAAHYQFGWSVSGPNDEHQLHAGPGPGDSSTSILTPVYEYDGDLCHPVGGANSCAPPTYSSCDRFDRPDEPVRVFRFQGGDGPRLQMNMGISTKNRRWIGDTLENLDREQMVDPAVDPDGDESRSCTQNIVYKAPGGASVADPAPWEFNQEEWLTSPYHVSGQNPAVYALMHVEFRGSEYQGGEPGDPITDYCGGGVYDCWMGSTTLAKSVPEDGDGVNPPIVNRLGAKYGGGGGYHGGENSIVATLPQQYHPRPDPSDSDVLWGYRGYEAITNIIKKGAYYYFVGGTVGSPPGQPPSESQVPGTCLFRTDDLDDPSSWRAWDGVGFNTRYRSPYQGADPFPWSASLTPAERHEQICEPINRSVQLFPPRQLTFNESLKKFVLVGRTQSGATSGIYYSLSDDLLNWTPRQLIVADPETDECPEEDHLGYPVLLDPDDAARTADPTQSGANTNFDHPDRTSYLFATRSACPNLVTGKDLVRTPIKFMQRSASLEPPVGPADPSDPNQEGFDGTTGTFVTETSGGGYGGSTHHAEATSTPASSAAYASMDTRWNNGDDVWYGAAFKLPPDFYANGAVGLLNWQGGGNTYGSLARRWENNNFQLVRGAPGNPEHAYIGGNDPAYQFTLPTGRWVWVEVHQRFSTSDAGAINEVFVDGRLVVSKAERNRVDSSTITSMRFGITGNPAPIPSTVVGVDRASIVGGQYGAHRGNGASDAPEAPRAFRKAFSGNGNVGFAWTAPDDDEDQNGVPDITGYRLYEQRADGTWQTTSHGPLSGGTYFVGRPCGPIAFRLTTYRAYGDMTPENSIESVVTPPVVVDPCVP